MKCPGCRVSSHHETDDDQAHEIDGVPIASASAALTGTATSSPGVVTVALPHLPCVLAPASSSPFPSAATEENTK